MVFPTLSFLIFYLIVWPLAWGAVRLGRHSLHKLVIIVVLCVGVPLVAVGIAAGVYASKKKRVRAATKTVSDGGSGVV